MVRNQGDIERGDSFTIGGGPTGGGNEGNTDSHILDFIIPPTGDDEYRTYFIEVDSPGADTGPYELFVTRFNGAWLEGDFDFDGDVDADDIDFYSGNIGAAALGRLAPLDFDRDGVVELEDHDFLIETFVETSDGGTGTLIGDINLDGTVNVLGDIFVIIGSLGMDGGFSEGDLNADGFVNILGDIARAAPNFGQTSDP